MHAAASLQPEHSTQDGTTDDPTRAQGSKEGMRLRLSDLIQRQQAALRAQAGVPDLIKRPAEQFQDTRKRLRIAEPEIRLQVKSPDQCHGSAC